MANTTPLALIKFGKREHLNQIRDEGWLRMCTVGHYRDNYEQDDPRSDPNEGVSRIYQPEQSTITIYVDDESYTFDPNELAGPAIISMNEDLDYNVFCMYTLYYEGDVILPADEENLRFGDHALLIPRPYIGEFFNRVDIAAQQAGFGIQRNFVTYVDENRHHGGMGPFRKFDRFAYQNEYRFVLDPTGEDPYWLNIGSITDISEIIPAKDVNRITIERKPKHH